MTLLRNLRIGQRLGLGNAVSALLLVLMVGAGVARLGQVQDKLQLVGADRLPKIVAVDSMEANLLQRAVILRNIVFAPNPAKAAQLSQQLPPLADAYAALQAQLDATVTSVAGKAALHDAELAVAATVPAFDEAVRLAVASDRSAAATLVEQRAAPLQDAALLALKRLAKTQLDAVEVFKREAQDAYHESLVEQVALGAVSVVLLAVFGWLLARSITRPIDQAVALAQAVAAGDLTRTVDAQGRSETARLLRSLDTMQQNLTSLVTDVRGNAGSVATASAEIAQGNADLSVRTERQASALQQTAASMEELMSTVNQNAENARQADLISVDASAVAQRGGAAVERVVGTMHDIRDSSRQVTEIISVIEGIAFQTNILALNAAVEAARAGEQGRGFAVVAGEVRGLAQRAADAARQIKGLVEASVERVGAGTALADEAGTTMREVLQSISRLSAVVGEISVASREQSTGVGQVGAAVTHMDHATQQNAALVEESAAAAESLKSQAQQLVQAVSTFRLASV